MSSPLNILDPVAILQERFSTAIAAAFPALAGQEIDPAVSPTKTVPGKPKFGDFQCNAAMALSKIVSMPPREVAAKIVEKIDLGDIAEPLNEKSIAGPGFINITIKSEALGALLTKMNAPDLGVAAVRTQTVVVDLCGVNLAKQMHVGHLRSTVIGDTLARVLLRLGNTVIRQNHVGDWGLPIAMVIRRLMDEQEAGRFDAGTLTLDKLETLYKVAQKSCEAGQDDIEFARLWHMGPKIIAELEAAGFDGMANLTRAKKTLVDLQSGDAKTLSMWKLIVGITMASCYENCRRLNSIVLPEHDAGESSYRDALGPTVADLETRRIAETDRGALVIRLEGLEPLLIRKSDGGFLYATTDLAAIRHRVGTLNASRVVYCVDARQSLHFKQVFAGAHAAGYDRTRDGVTASLEHAAFGAILGDDGRPFKTRSGENFKLADLLDEAQERAEAAVLGRNPDLAAEDRKKIAHAVSIAAIRYADLSGERIKDYVFHLDRMLAFEGNTGPYLLYALVRIKSIFRKAAERNITVPSASGELRIVEPAERTLALALLGYGGAVKNVAETLMPNRLCQYVYELAGAFSSFFDQCPVLVAPDQATRDARLRLCALTERVLEDALGLLGIPVVERM